MEATASRPRVELFLSFLSLWTYVGIEAFHDLARRRDLEIVYKPMDLLAVFAASGGLPVKQRAPQRQAYRLVEMQRWRAARGIPLVLQPRHYPFDPSTGHRMLLAALRAGSAVDAFVRAALRGVWAGELDLGAPETLVRLADAAGLDGRALLAESADPALHREERALTEEALARQVFGAPCFFFRGEPFWGQDRLPQLEEAISTGRAPISVGESEGGGKNSIASATDGG